MKIKRFISNAICDVASRLLDADEFIEMIQLYIDKEATVDSIDDIIDEVKFELSVAYCEMTEYELQNILDYLYDIQTTIDNNL